MAPSASEPSVLSPVSAAPGPLVGKTILLLPYSHMDWAWCFTRRWHLARYTAIFDEALRLAAADPAFCLFIDSLAESIEPYFGVRPEAREAWNRLVEAGRFAVVGGQYVNLRPATAPEELFLRNLEVGRRVLADLLPAARPCGYANLDTAIGHSQLPQILALARLRYLLVGRSEAGLAQDGLPKLFRWEGPEGSSILVLVQHYGVCAESFQRLADPASEVRAKAQAEFNERLRPQAALGLDTVYAIIGADDNRYLHDASSDRPYDLPGILSAGGAHGASAMILATPDELVRRILPQAARLELRRGALDQADVAYNGPFGQHGLRELRDRTAAALVEAEVYDALAAASGVDRENPPDLEQAWRQALRGQSHATQYLFAADTEALRQDLAEALRQAEAAREDAFERLAPGCLPQDSDTVAVLNPLPWERSCLVSVPVCRTDFSVPGFRLTDDTGAAVPQQALPPPNGHRVGEWDILARLTLPPGGVRILRRVPDPTRSPRRPEALALTGRVQAGPCCLTWEDGRLCQVEGGGFALAGSAAVSILEPLRHPTQVRGWMTTAIEAPAERVKVLSLRQCEEGPLRWGFERTLACGPHRLRQWLHLDAEARLDVTTEIAYGADLCTFALAIPCSPAARLLASIPFGVEARTAAPVEAAPDASSRIIERLVPGVFYARDWVSCSTPIQDWALAVLEGDRYWLCRDGAGCLEHLLLRVTEPVAEGWEQFTQMNRPGFMRFRHVLVAGASASPDQLSRLTDGGRFPVRCRDVRPGAVQDGLSLAKLDGGQARLIAWRRRGDEMELRLVQSADRSAVVELRCVRPIQAARLVDLLGVALPAPVELRPSGEARFTLRPGQIATLRFRLGAEVR